VGDPGDSGTSQADSEGLTPGFWKTHSRFGPAPLESWPETGLDPNDDYESLFGVEVPGTPGLIDALDAKGGGVNALLRHSAAALLNAAHPNVHYPLTYAGVVQLTRDAIDSGDRDQIESLKDRFDAANNLGATLDEDQGDDAERRHTTERSKRVVSGK
jgi:hypothetical protein